MLNRYDSLSFDVLQEKWLETHQPIGVYIHTPFCNSICSYCVYPGRLLEKYAQDFQIYFTEYLPSVLELYSNILTTKVDLIDTWYFGGGTPSLMPPEIMKSLFQSIPGFKEHTAPKTFEIHPAIYTSEQLDVLKEFQFDNVLLCQQTLNESTLRNQGREVSDIDHLSVLASECRDRGFFIGVDLIAFLNKHKKDTEILRDDLKKLYEKVYPDQLSVQTVYQEKESFNEETMVTVYNSDFIKHGKYDIVSYYEDVDVTSLPDLIKFHQNKKCITLLKKCSGINYNLRNYMNQNWALGMSTPYNTLGIGSFRNPVTHTYSNIGPFNYIECNNDNTCPSFKYVSSGFAQEMSFFTHLFEKTGIPPMDIEFYMINNFVAKHGMPLYLEWGFYYSSSKKEHEAYVKAFQKQIDIEEENMFKRLKL